MFCYNKVISHENCEKEMQYKYFKLRNKINVKLWK